MADERDVFLSISMPDEADRGGSEDWDREGATEQDRNPNGDLMLDLASPYGFRRVVTLSGGGPGCLAAPAADLLPDLAPIRILNREPFRGNIEPGQTRLTLPYEPVTVACRTNAGVVIPHTVEGRDVVLPAAPIVPIACEWTQWTPMYLTRFRWSRDKDAGTVSWTLEAKE